jgi:hypothetical protein
MRFQIGSPVPMNSAAAGTSDCEERAGSSVGLTVTTSASFAQASDLSSGSQMQAGHPHWHQLPAVVCPAKAVEANGALLLAPG